MTATRPANFSPLTPLSFLRRSAAVFPHRTAIVYADREYTYAEFKSESERLARAIRATITAGDRVAFVAPNIPELLIAHFAVPLAGGVLVAINSRLAPREIDTILKHSGASLVFVDAEFVGAISSEAQKRADGPRIVVIPDASSDASATTDYERFDEFIVKADDSDADLDWDVQDENAVISINYTSGTTGEPKGVMYTHRGAYLNALGEVYHNGFDARSVYLWTLPMFHCNGWCTPWAVTAASAAHICLRAVRPDAVWRAIDRYHVSNLCGSPTVCGVIADASEAHRLEWSLRVTTAGAPPSPTVIQRLESLGMTVVHVYGLTEVYGPFTICEYQNDWDALPASERAERISRQGVSMIQADPARVVTEDMNDVPSDGRTVGEVVLRGNTVMLGYFDDDAATEHAFRGGWFHTGDLAVVHTDGYLEVVDRAKDIIISGGENISSIEVENALLSHPDVLDAAVVSYPHTKWGERPKAYVSIRPGRNANTAEILRHVRSLVAGFKVPDYVVVLPELPRTATGKVTKNILRAISDVPATQ